MTNQEITQLILHPPSNSVIFETELVYAALASYPLTKGHTIVVWKKEVNDLGELNSQDYAYLMLTVDKIRNVLMNLLKVKKVYLMYMDEVKHVHWHLIPRYSTAGFTILKTHPKLINKFPLAPILRKSLDKT